MLRGMQSPIAVTTWANRGSFGSGDRNLAFFTDYGASGSMMVWNGTRWCALNGAAQMKFLTTAVTGITNSEAIPLQALLPIASWQTGDILRIWLVSTKTGSTDSSTITVRIGTAGTTADTAITGLSAFPFMTTSGLAGGGIWDIKLISATSAQKMGSTTSNVHTYQNLSNTTGQSNAITITDASANALYVSVGLASSGASNTVSAVTGMIQLITP